MAEEENRVAEEENRVAEEERGSHNIRITVRAHEFVLPPVHDGLIIGRNAPVGCMAMHRALTLLSTAPFESIEIPDHPTISDFIVRKDILRRVSRERLVQCIVQQIAPLMGETEVFHLDLEIVVHLETEL